ncbi:hypothetical protein ACFZB9_19275 [Kitasatospora sp. NPDC008050]|uniref:hypothetical protein n=1 Tax=Kitasatospora sp. NPDC008050 TaxID=3364021 RepID=UPI0036F04C8E
MTAAVVIGGIVALGVNGGTVLRPGTPERHDAGSAVAAGPACPVDPLAQVLAAARESGASVITAKGALTGRPGPESPSYVELRLTDVRTVSGPTVASESHAWIYSALGPSGPMTGTDAGSLWAADGSLFGIVRPRSSSVDGPTVRVAPVVGDQVILSRAGCWSASDLAGRPFTGPLAEVPGSNSYARAAETGFVAVPLNSVEALATQHSPQ